ncbi:hypothetical protein ACPX19_02025 [Winogradskyella sp. HB-48]|uniref:hypothetical protein n=1 Tax=Winogradskyella sp. HB-48 TaxID=3416808 RepID=UPI003CF296FF
MVDVDLYDVQILTSQEVDLTQVSHVKEIQSQNIYLKYGLVTVGVVFTALLFYLNYENKKSKSDK